MEKVQYIINNINDYVIWIALAVVILGMISLILVIHNIILSRKIKKLTKGIKGENIYTLIEKYYDRIDKEKMELSDKLVILDEINSKVNKSMQKFEIIRYKAFDDVGGDLSFSLAMLDDKNDGLILTGIHGRDFNGIYAKPVKSGATEYDLSNEEKRVLEEVVKK